MGTSSLCANPHWGQLIGNWTYEQMLCPVDSCFWWVGNHLSMGLKLTLFQPIGSRILQNLQLTVNCAQYHYPQPFPLNKQRILSHIPTIAKKKHQHNKISQKDMILKKGKRMKLISWFSSSEYRSVVCLLEWNCGKESKNKKQQMEATGKIISNNSMRDEFIKLFVSLRILIGYISLIIMRTYWTA